MALTEVNSLGIKDLEVKTGDIAADAVTNAKIADDQIDSEHYVDGSIDTVHLADDAVNYQKIADNTVGLAHLQHGTDGQILTFDANGAPAYVGPGTDGQVLTSTGAGSPPAFEDASGGAALSNDGNNRIVTGTGSGGINGEANLTFDGNTLTQTIDAGGEGIKQQADGNHYIANIMDADVTSGAGYAIAMLDARWNNTSVAEIRFVCGDDTTNKDDSDITFHTAASGSKSEVLRLTQEKNVEIADGNLVLASGHGIDFGQTSDTPTGGASTDSELFDDYEEGSWTPADGGGIVGFATATGKYVKMGKQVTLWFYITCTSNVTSTGNAYIVALPWTSENDNAGGQGVAALLSSKGDGVISSWRLNANSSIMYAYQETGNAYVTKASAWDGDSTTSAMWGTLSYRAA